jgi:hypothetical protein
MSQQWHGAKTEEAKVRAAISAVLILALDEVPAIRI